MTDEWYLIWSNEHRGWWRASSQGYTKNLNEAGTYTRDAALTICRNAIPTAAHIDMISELPVRMTDVNEFLAGQLIPEAIRKDRDSRSEEAERFFAMETAKKRLRQGASLKQILACYALTDEDRAELTAYANERRRV